MADLESRGLPTVCIATVEFTDGADRQMKALGADLATVFVSHPIQDRTTAEMIEIADSAIGEIVTGLCGAA